jgi:hypothetical protein
MNAVCGAILIRRRKRPVGLLLVRVTKMSRPVAKIGRLYGEMMLGPAIATVENRQPVVLAVPVLPHRKTPTMLIGKNPMGICGLRICGGKRLMNNRSLAVLVALVLRRKPVVRAVRALMMR